MEAYYEDEIKNKTEKLEKMKEEIKTLRTAEKSKKLEERKYEQIDIKQLAINLESKSLTNVTNRYKKFKENRTTLKENKKKNDILDEELKNLIIKNKEDMAVENLKEGDENLLNGKNDTENEIMIDDSNIKGDEKNVGKNQEENEDKMGDHKVLEKDKNMVKRIENETKVDKKKSDGEKKKVGRYTKSKNKMKELKITKRENDEKLKKMKKRIKKLKKVVKDQDVKNDFMLDYIHKLPGLENYHPAKADIERFYKDKQKRMNLSIDSSESSDDDD